MQKTKRKRQKARSILWQKTRSMIFLLMRSCKSPRARGAHQGAGRARRARSAGKQKKAKGEADDASDLANQALDEATDAENMANEADEKAVEEDMEEEMTPEVDPLPQDEAAAVGDPHMTLSTGDSQDLCCSGAVCKPCSSALLQRGGKPKRGPSGCRTGKKGKKCRKAKKAKKDAAAAKELANQALLESQTAEDKADEAEQIVDAEESLEDSEDTDDVADEAAAVGDPHMTISTGDKLDLCCDGGVCKAC